MLDEFFQQKMDGIKRLTTTFVYENCHFKFLFNHHQCIETLISPKRRDIEFENMHLASPNVSKEITEGLFELNNYNVFPLQ